MGPTRWRRSNPPPGLLRRRAAESVAWALVTGLAVATAAHAADEIRLSSLPATLAPGATGTMQIVYVRDTSGTPLGVDQAAGAKIQSFSIKIAYSPASAFSSLSLSRAGLLAALTPKAGESNPTTAGTASYLGSFAESSNPVPFNLDAPAPGNLVLQATYTVAPAPPTGTVTFTLDAAVTLLANEAGTIDETVADGGITLTGGSLVILSNAATNLYAQAVSASAIELRWIDPGMNETGFRVERSLDGTSWSTASTVGPNDTTYTDTGRSAATLYYYRLVTLVPGDAGISKVAAATTFPSTAAKVCAQKLPGSDATWARYPAAAWNSVDGEWGVAWDAREDGVQDDIYFQRRNSTTLAPLGPPINVSQNETTSIFPTVAWNGSGYLVAWYEHQRREPGTLAGAGLLARFALLGPDGT
ncbi:MAG TPA: fibronectin type III domain-containing protein, partial [Thermoanaerobaculia bacterium]|nr:fibronectin type III domain-containing protein [Thermoanaerobaculia bacterium]